MFRSLIARGSKSRVSTKRTQHKLAKPFPLKLGGFGAIGFSRTADGHAELVVTVAHALVGPMFVSRADITGCRDVLYASIMDEQLAAKYPTQYIHKSYFKGGTDLAILVHHNAKKAGLPTVLARLRATTLKHGHPLTAARRSAVSSRKHFPLVKVTDANYGPVTGYGSLQPADHDALLIVQGIGYPGLSGSMAEVDGKLVGPYCARLPARWEPANSVKIQGVCNYVIGKVADSTKAAIALDSDVPAHWRNAVPAVVPGGDADAHTEQAAAPEAHSDPKSKPADNMPGEPTQLIVKHPTTAETPVAAQRPSGLLRMRYKATPAWLVEIKELREDVKMMAHRVDATAKMVGHIDSRLRSVQVQVDINGQQLTELVSRRAAVQPLIVGVRRTMFDQLESVNWVKMPKYQLAKSAQRVHAFDATTDVDFSL